MLRLIRMEKYLPEEAVGNRMEAYRRFGLTESPDAIFITSGSIVSRKVTSPEGAQETVRYSTTGFNDLDARGLVAWGKIRVIAGGQLAEDFPKATVVTLSRSTNNMSEYSDASVAEKELKGMMGVENMIERSESSVDTFTELLSIVRLMIERSWSKTAVVATRFQLPRMRAMLESIKHVGNPDERAKIEQLLTFNEKRFGGGSLPTRVDDIKSFRSTYEFILAHENWANGADVALIPAEDIVPLRDARYAEIVRQAEGEDAYTKKLAQDEAAAGQWQRGEYGKQR